MTRAEELKKRQRETFSESMYRQRKDIYSRIYQEHKEDPKILRKAKALVAFLKEKDIFLQEDDLIAGYQQLYDFSEPPEEPSLYELCLEGGKNRVLMDEYEKASKIGLFGGGLGGHVIPDFEGVLRKGFARLQSDAEKKLGEGGEIDRDFLSAVIIICKGVEHYIKRYAQKASLLAEKTKSAKYRGELKRISQACEWVATKPPRTFFEATQLFWLAHEILTASQSSGSLSPGRFDQYMFPFYWKDLQEKRITRGEAGELIEVLWIKINGLCRGFQNIILGGQKMDGSDATNDLSYLCLEATEKLRLPQPALSVRYHSKTPEEFFDRACKVIRTGGGLPALFNDEVIIPAKERSGIAREDVINYGIIGCVEPAIPGKEFGHTEALRINWAKILELMFNNGACAITGEKMKMKNKATLKFDSFDQLYRAYREELGYFIDLGVKALKILDKNFFNFCPYPYLSTIMWDCIENGRDVTAGGTKYNLMTINGCGMADAADSLAAIKKIVYEDRRISLEELKNALHSNFSGKEPLRQRLINKAPKYGNDDNYADELLKELVEEFCNRIMQYNNPRGGKFQTGLYTVDWHATAGKLTSALPDGRFVGRSLANSLSPSQGRDKSGPTSVINSITKFDHTLLGNGMVLDMKFTPRMLAEEEVFEKFKELIKTYFSQRGLEIQFNVIDRETLIKAQEKPDEYQNLVVRVSGFSAYFTSLEKTLQDEIIARTTQSY